MMKFLNFLISVLDISIPEWKERDDCRFFCPVSGAMQHKSFLVALQDEEEGEAEPNSSVMTIAVVLNNLVNWLQSRNAVASHLRKPLLSNEAPVGKKDTVTSGDTKEYNKEWSLYIIAGNSTFEWILFSTKLPVPLSQVYPFFV